MNDKKCKHTNSQAVELQRWWNSLYYYHFNTYQKNFHIQLQRYLAQSLYLSNPHSRQFLSYYPYSSYQAAHYLDKTEAHGKYGHPSHTNKSGSSSLTCKESGILNHNIEKKRESDLQTYPKNYQDSQARMLKFTTQSRSSYTPYFRSGQRHNQSEQKNQKVQQNSVQENACSILRAANRAPHERVRYQQNSVNLHPHFAYGIADTKFAKALNSILVRTHSARHVFNS